MIDYHTYLVTVVQKAEGVYSAVCETESHSDTTPLGQGHGASEAQAINRAVADHLLQRNKVTAVADHFSQQQGVIADGG